MMQPTGSESQNNRDPPTSDGPSTRQAHRKSDSGNDASHLPVHGLLFLGPLYGGIISQPQNHALAKTACWLLL
jgi:hypothetical protein